MTRLSVDATTLIALGSIGALDVLHAFDGELVVLREVAAEVTTEPANTNLEGFLGDPRVSEGTSSPGSVDRALGVLGDPGENGDAHLIAAVLDHTASDEPVGVVSDDRRVRTVARGLGARVSGTIGAIVRAVHGGLGVDEAADLVRELDAHGLHMTADLREAALDIIEDAGG